LPLLRLGLARFAGKGSVGPALFVCS
jgi:hypothetical protein